jgi:hypothetical protein
LDEDIDDEDEVMNLDATIGFFGEPANFWIRPIDSSSGDDEDPDPLTGSAPGVQNGQPRNSAGGDVAPASGAATKANEQSPTDGEPKPSEQTDGKLTGPMRLISYSMPGFQLDHTLRIRGDATWQQFLYQVCKTENCQDISGQYLLVDGTEPDPEETIDVTWFRGIVVEVKFEEQPWYERMALTVSAVTRPA